nr:RNA-directed DNA polymerase, eukaryota [Tanacetum cinerariifolium]
MYALGIYRLKFHANIARYHKTPMNASNTQVKNDVEVHRSNTYVFKNTNGDTGVGNSYVQVVKGKNQDGVRESETKPAIVLDDECMYSKDLSTSLMGVGSWFSQPFQASTDFTNEGRIVWVEIEGIPIKLWPGNTFKRIASKWGELLDIDDEDDRCFHSKRLCVYTKIGTNIFESFKIIFRGKVFWIRAQEVPGWAPDFVEESDNEDQSDDGSKDGSPKVNDSDSCGDDSDVTKVPEIVFEESGQKDKKEAEESTGKQENHSEDPFSIYKLLKQKKDYVGNDDKSNQSLKYPPGFTPNEGTNGSNMNVGDSRNDNSVKIHEYIMAEGNSVRNGEGLAQKAKKDWVKKLCVKNKMNFLALQETKMENMEIFSVKMCWGNYAFDYVHSDSVGNSRGNDMLIVAVYAQHDLRDKHILWDYLAYEITKWKGEVVIMGDFNEVLFRSDRFGSVFNAQGASMFNSFIVNAGLEEVPLGGKDTWNEAPCDGSNAMINMMKKLKYLKMRIMEWNKRNMNNMKNVATKHTEDLKALEARIDKGEGTTEIVNKRMEVVKNLQSIDKLQSGIMVDGVWTERLDMVKREFFQHFSRRFDKPVVHRAHIDMTYPKSLSGDQQIEFERDVSKNEIKKAVWDWGTDKSPGPDGFSFGFYRHFRKLIENDVFEAVQKFFTNGEIPKAVIHHHCKILANRLVGVLGDIVDEVQSAFIADRQILDGPFILNEVLQWCKLKNKQSLIFKADFEKAYDSVCWDFLDDVLKKFGFEDKWCNWIQSCLKSSRGSIIINGSPTEEFQFLKGLKQGDHLSPFLFLLIMESLHLSFPRVVDAGLFKALHGLRINMSKSKLMGVSVESDKVKWNEVVEMVKNRLSKWKMKALSVEGLICKWVWRFYNHNTSLWARVIKAIHGDDGSVGKHVKAGTQSCWMTIVNEITVLKKHAIDIFDFMRIKLGNEDKVAFWEDKELPGFKYRHDLVRDVLYDVLKRAGISSKKEAPVNFLTDPLEEAYNNHHNLGINIKIYGKNQRTKKRRISPNKMQFAQVIRQRISTLETVTSDAITLGLYSGMESDLKVIRQRISILETVIRQRISTLETMTSDAITLGLYSGMESDLK